MFGLGGTAVAIVVGLVLVWVLAPFFTVEQGEAGVVARWGKVVKVAGPGLNFKWPLIDSVTRMSTRIEKRGYDKVLSYSRDVQEAAIRVSVNYRRSTDQEVFSTYGVNYVEHTIRSCPTA
jgi:regulator of protease activity HflC (stomatin/prohibitin superfamily)